MIGETAEIGDRVTLYQGVTLGGTGFARGKRHPTLGDDVTIGSGAKLLGPVTVGHGAKVGANTVVIEDVPPNSTVVGNPGHPVRVEGRRPEGPDADWIHLPDPIAEAIRALAERLGALESASPSSTASPPTREVNELRAPPRPDLGRRLRPVDGRRRERVYPRSMSAEATHGAPIAPGADPVERLLADLNPPQREAVTHGEGPLLVLAGAGSGKTRVLTHRIAWLLATGRARPMRDPRDHVHQQGRERDARAGRQPDRRDLAAMWVMTFHSACARILRAEAPRLGYKRTFTIYDEADSVRMVKRCLDELEIDPKRYPPRSVKAAISAAKNQLTDAADYARAAETEREQAIADVYNLYERRMLEASAMDFDDLLVRTVNLLELFEDVREKYRRIFRWVLVDEYQDTNRAQYRLLQLLASEHRNLTVVGDDFQCLVEGTEVTMGDGSVRRIEELDVGDQVLSGHGPGDFRPSAVTGVYAVGRDSRHPDHHSGRAGARRAPAITCTSPVTRPGLRRRCT